MSRAAWTLLTGWVFFCANLEQKAVAEEPVVQTAPPPATAATESAAPSQDQSKPPVSSSPPPPKPRRIVREKEAEGSEAKNRFTQDPVAKSQYRLGGQALEVDPD